MDIKNICKDAESIGVSGHIRPDGDCVGACLGLFLYLKKLFPKKEVKLFLEKPADSLSCLKGFEEITVIEAEKGEKVPAELSGTMSDNSIGEPCFDVFFAVDCEKGRLGAAEKLFDAAALTVNIDHHISNAEGTGRFNYIKPDASSASELVYELIEKEYLDEDIAAALYVGIVHDTGVFKYSNTSPETLEAAAELIGYGFDFSALIEKTYFEKTYEQNQIMGRALMESMLFLDGRCVVSYIDQHTMQFYQVTGKDMDGIVSQLKLTKGVECAIFMYEIETLTYKVSLRSGGIVNVAEIAELFGGGGHVRAAGCTMNGTFHDVINNLSIHIEEQLEKGQAE